jgi:hypothetical protein
MFLICKIDLSTLVRLKFKRNSTIQVFVEEIINRKGLYRQESKKGNEIGHRKQRLVDYHISGISFKCIM